ncbi:hypothetical protein [Exiguobacterium sp. AT1b]|uniref:hypothetical protein n=1 Tax=Exiguobacterium sp. (strain ATCC BAA-1283 / AT1b) TaxID=360911 RepID=UPI000AA830E7|nr:hypothetical protein [Exiguobacterium sp. AT1b]
MDRAIHLPPTLGFAPRRLEEGEFSPDLVKVVSADGRPLSLEQVIKRTLYKDVVYPATLGIPLIRALHR